MKSFKLNLSKVFKLIFVLFSQEEKRIAKEEEKLAKMLAKEEKKRVKQEAKESLLANEGGSRK